MKKLMTMILMFSAFAVNAQTKTFPLDTATKKITYSEVINVSGATKDQLYQRAKNLGISGKGVQKDDAAQGLYVYKGAFNVSYPAPQPGLQHKGQVEYLVTLACKDGRYKYIITNLTHSGEKGSGGKLEGAYPECGKLLLTLAGWGSIKVQTMEQMDKFIARLKASMEGLDPNAPKVGTDW
ncbi:MAG TPA: DUF4468 domain-containing protein [Cytophagaceae bacterium]|jgi:hypothetical protein|nr:DUF4468 domain-containing protein [Cytophagaceae bacterium]